MIPRIYKNYLRTLRITRTFYNNFTNRKGYRGLVKVNKEIGEYRNTPRNGSGRVILGRFSNISSFLNNSFISLYNFNIRACIESPA